MMSLPQFLLECGLTYTSSIWYPVLFFSLKSASEANAAPMNGVTKAVASSKGNVRIFIPFRQWLQIPGDRENRLPSSCLRNDFRRTMFRIPGNSLADFH